MNNVTIPADDAKRLAAVLRHQIIDPGREERLRWADLLDPPPPSLRDEVARLIDIGVEMSFPRDSTAKEILSVVRRHVEGLPCCECKGRGQASRHGVTDLIPCWVCDAGRAPSPPLSRYDVLQLLGAGDD